MTKLIYSFEDKYKIIEKIGEGSFSEVVKCEDRKTREQFAAKKLKKSFKNIHDVLYCAEIIATQKLSRHVNVLYMLEYLFDPLGGKVIFIFELMDMSMFDYMRQRKRIAEAKVKVYLYQMLKGLEHLHRNGLFHRDIKPENILVKLPAPSTDSTIFEGELVKLADLGSIRGIFSQPPYTEYISTRWYRSPECLLTMGNYGPKMDVWAVGCVFYEMLMFKPLFPGNNEIDQLYRIHSLLGTPSHRLLYKFKKRSKNFETFPRLAGSGLGPLLCNISEDAQILLKLMLQYDPDARINVRRLLENKYFRRLKEDDVLKKFEYSYHKVSPFHRKGQGDYPMINYLGTSNIWRTNKYQSTNSNFSSFATTSNLRRQFITNNPPNQTRRPGGSLYANTSVGLSSHNTRNTVSPPPSVTSKSSNNSGPYRHRIKPIAAQPPPPQLGMGRMKQFTLYGSNVLRRPPTRNGTLLSGSSSGNSSRIGNHRPGGGVTRVCATLRTQPNLLQQHQHQPPRETWCQLKRTGGELHKPIKAGLYLGGQGQYDLYGRRCGGPKSTDNYNMALGNGGGTFRKTTSNLPQMNKKTTTTLTSALPKYKTTYEPQKVGQFQSKSFVLPKRMSGQYKINTIAELQAQIIRKI